MGLHPLGGLGLENTILFLEPVQFVQTAVEIHDDENEKYNPDKHRHTTQIDGNAVHGFILPAVEKVGKNTTFCYNQRPLDVVPFVQRKWLSR
jgi:hypothetical protein